MPTEFVTEEQRARTMVARLELVSHGTIAKIGGQIGPKNDDGPVFPPGGITAKDDLEIDHPHKSHVYFRRRLEACRSEPEFGELAKTVEDAIEAWRHTGKPPKDSEAWRKAVGKEMAARDRGKRGATERIAAKWKISKASAYQLEQEYLRKAAA